MRKTECAGRPRRCAPQKVGVSEEHVARLAIEMDACGAGDATQYRRRQVRDGAVDGGPLGKDLDAKSGPAASLGIDVLAEDGGLVVLQVELRPYLGTGLPREVLRQPRRDRVIEVSEVHRLDPGVSPRPKLNPVRASIESRPGVSSMYPGA